MMEYPKTLVLILLITAFGNLTASDNPKQDPISIKGNNNFTGESINAIREGQSLQLVCVVRNSSLTGISWLRNDVKLTYNRTLISQDPRYGIRVDETQKGRRFFRLSIRNISRNDSGNFTCTSGMGSSVEIRVRFAPGSDYPLCSKELISSDNTSEVGYTQVSCSTERGVPPYSTKWFRKGIPQNAAEGVTSDINNGVFTSVIRSDINESVYSELECRLFLRSEEVFGRRCCIGCCEECNSTTSLTSQASTMTNQEDSTVTEAVDYSDNELTTTLTKNNETLGNISNNTTGSTGTIPITYSTDTTERDDLSTYDLDFLDGVTEMITDGITDSPATILITYSTDTTVSDDLLTYDLDFLDEVTEMRTDEITDSPLTPPIYKSTFFYDVEKLETDTGHFDSTLDSSDATTLSQDILNSTKNNNFTTHDLDSSEGNAVTNTSVFEDVTSGFYSPDYGATIQTNKIGDIANRSNLNNTRFNNEALGGVCSMTATLGLLVLALMSAFMF